MNEELKVGDRVEKRMGDYYFQGYVVAVFTKHQSNLVRVVVENSDRALHIFSPSQLVKV